MINIDTVYQKVLLLANKEQRGYITPQEFNLFADHAQKEIFEQYFYDLNQFNRIPGNQTKYADIVNNIKEKISRFERYDKQATILNKYSDINLDDDFPDLYRITMVRVSYKSKPKYVYIGQENPSSMVIAEHTPLSELTSLLNSKLTAPSRLRPIYTQYAAFPLNKRIKVYPKPSFTETYSTGPRAGQLKDRVVVSYIASPRKPNWTYQVVNQKPFFNDNNETRNFELHESEEQELVYRILGLAGITLQRPDLLQTAAGLQGATLNQEKQ
tara:strand:- start:985 stop:1794 length:810 start_codon:yes stop_codon:yes gene_type:complete